MCGIAGFVGKPLNGSDLIINAMTDVLSHRGPDGSGHFVENGVAFGHTRLSIVDLSNAGHQPMRFKDRYVITYNGEVYNHVEIRSELEEHGYQFYSHTDTEVIMAAYDKWGAECVKKFNGMSAFCIYDKQTDMFFLSRDRFGIKPLYYFSDGETFVFSSEVKSILEHPAVLAVPNKPYINEYVAGRATEHLKETPFKNIYRFAFSSYAQVTREELLNGFKEEVFWSVAANTSKEKFTIIEGDFLKKDFTEIFNNQQVAIIGNFPYNISSQIVFKAIENREFVPEFSGMFQKEVAQRIAEKEGSKTYGILSVLTQAFYDAEYLFTVPPSVFNPPPKVDSGVIRLIRKENYTLPVDEKLFFRVVKTSFNQRRKMLRSSLKSFNISDSLKEEAIFTMRPEQLSVQKFIELTKMIAQDNA